MPEINALKYTIMQIIPIAGYWNIYIDNETQEEVRIPVSCLALIHEEGVRGAMEQPSHLSLNHGRQKLKYIDLLDILGQEYHPENFDHITFMRTEHESRFTKDGLQD